jgi:hypothetical protein
VKTIKVKDNEDLIVFVDVDFPTVEDPISTVGAVTRLYRVIGNKTHFGHLELIPMSEPVTVSSEALHRMAENDSSR